VKKV
jgi:hypothetical protein